MESSLAERTQRVRILLETMNDPYPTPRGALRSDAGPAPSKYVPCQTCRRSGWVKQRRRYVLCLICDGRGWKRRQKTDQAWDAYLEMPLVEAADLPREATPVSLRQVADEVAEAEGRYERLSYGWERLQKAYERQGSYREVRRHLAWLSEAQPRRYRLVRSVLVDHEPRILEPALTVELDLGVVAITLRMRSIRVPPWLIERSAAAERRASITELAAHGLRVGEIARTLGLSKEAVRRKLKPIPAL
jgi:hypothetical protein